MIKRILPVLLALSVLLTACGAEGTPTMLPADIEGTAMSSAWTMVAETQIAIPTATAIPPTETPSPTPLPTFTAVPLVLPTLPPVLPTATEAASSDPNNCSKVLDLGEAGATHRARVENQTGSQVNLSIGIYTPNTFGQCGTFITPSLAKGESYILAIPSGAWYAYAWVLNPPSTVSTNFFIGPSSSQDLNRLVIKKDSVVWLGP